MEQLILHLLAYNPVSRGIDRDLLEHEGLRAESTVNKVVEIASALLKQVAGCDQSAIARELAEAFSYRLIFLLLPEECLFGDPERDKPVISSHLRAMGINPDDDIVRAVKFLAENFRTKTRAENVKKGITDVFVRYPRIYDQILTRQNTRCAVCGARIVYGVNMTLDHVLPWHLGDDPPDGSNWQFLCERCNRGKGVYPYYSLSPVQANWIRPTNVHHLGDDVRYAVLKRDKLCAVSARGPKEVELTVRKRYPSGCWILDNLDAVAVDIF